MATAGLVDLSIVFRRRWHACGENEDRSSVARESFRTIVSYLDAHDYGAVCLDSKPYFRCEIDQLYKANREPPEQAMLHQQSLLIERLQNERGVEVLAAPTYEADDVLLTAAKLLVERGVEHVTIYSADKDLCAAVTERVSVTSTETGATYTPDSLRAKFGIEPNQFAEYLALIGDKADNVPGVDGVGPKRARDLLAEYKNIAGVIEAARQKKLGRFDSIYENRERLQLSLDVTTIRTDAPIDIEPMLRPKEETKMDEPEIIDAEPVMNAPSRIDVEVQMPSPVEPARQTRAERIEPLEVVSSTDLQPYALEPRTPEQAWRLAQAMDRARIFGNFPNIEAIYGVIMTGRTLGVDAITSLRSFDVIGGKACPKAQFLVGLVQRSPACEYLTLEESTDAIATWATKRVGAPSASRMSVTIEQAQRMGLTGKDNWKKQPDTMLMWRCVVKLLRSTYADVVSGLYAAEEFE